MYSDKFGTRFSQWQKIKTDIILLNHLMNKKIVPSVCLLGMQKVTSLRPVPQRSLSISVS